MKFLLVIFGLITTSYATQPATQTCITKIETCLNAAAVVQIPTFTIDAYIYLLGLVEIAVSAQLDCTAIAALVSAGTEISYNETNSNGVVTAVISIGVAANINLDLNAGVVVVTKILGIQIGVGACVITFVNVNIAINVIATFASGYPLTCKIKEIAPVCTKSDCSISPSGNPNVNTATGNTKDMICDQCFSGMQDSLQNVLNNAIEP